MSEHDPLFYPPADNWTTLDPAYLNQRRLGALLGWGFMVAVVCIPMWLVMASGGMSQAQLVAGSVVTAAGLIVILWRVLRQPAIFRAWGFAERETDLYIRSGVWVRRITVVPYGRMQAVKVRSGPIERLFKLASVQLVTASADSAAVIPGLGPEDAAMLRDRLTQRGENQAAGL